MTYPPTMPSQTTCARVPPPHGEKRWNTVDVSNLREDDLPIDPRTWDRHAVGAWVSRRGAIPERFPMNGKALCLMSADMFASRVPERGNQLYQEFRRRLARALALQELIEKLQMANK